jgi:hypothetical protein
MQHILNVLTPATSYDLISLADAKILLNIPASDTSQDARLALMISAVSAQAAKEVNRVFAREKVEETFFNTSEFGQRRVYFSRWPVVLADIESITQDGASILTTEGLLGDWILEEHTGTMYRPGSTWMGTINTTYTGGYDLPDGVPLDLQRAAMLMTQQSYFAIQRGDPSVRSISHKSARVQFFSLQQMMPNIGGAGKSGAAPGMLSIQSLLNHYRRDWV